MKNYNYKEINNAVCPYPVNKADIYTTRYERINLFDTYDIVFRITAIKSASDIEICLIHLYSIDDYTFGDKALPITGFNTNGGMLQDIKAGFNVKIIKESYENKKASVEDTISYTLVFTDETKLTLYLYKDLDIGFSLNDWYASFKFITSGTSDLLKVTLGDNYAAKSNIDPVFCLHTSTETVKEEMLNHGINPNIPAQYYCGFPINPAAQRMGLGYSMHDARTGVTYNSNMFGVGPSNLLHLYL